MPQVRCIALVGVHLVFYSNDHDPPHFHAVKRDDWHYRVRFLLPQAEMLEQVAGPRVLRGKTRRHLLQLSAIHRMELLEEWDATRPDE
jgi:hypothetical protein